jgi:hypothetical protein
MLLDCLLNRKSAMLGSGMRTLSAKDPTTAPNQMLHIPGWVEISMSPLGITWSAYTATGGLSRVCRGPYCEQLWTQIHLMSRHAPTASPQRLLGE